MATQLSNLFLEGGPLFMAILTLLLALLFLLLDLCLLERKNHILRNFHLFKKEK